MRMGVEPDPEGEVRGAGSDRAWHSPTGYGTGEPAVQMIGCVHVEFAQLVGCVGHPVLFESGLLLVENVRGGRDEERLHLRIGRQPGRFGAEGDLDEVAQDCGELRAVARTVSR